MSAFSSITINALGDYSGSYANARADINMNTIDGCIRTQKAIATPYGFHSLPKDNLTAVQLGNPNFSDSISIGYLNPCADITNSYNLKVGESEIFNNANYALRLELDKINVKWKGLQTRISNGENDTKMFVELFSQILAYINAMNDNWTTIYNEHKHGTSPLPDKTVVPYVPEAEFTSLKRQLDDDPTGDHIKGITNFIDKNGVTYT